MNNTILPLTDNDQLCGGQSALWKSFKNGNVSALEDIYITYFDLLCMYGRQFSPDDYSLVEDCLQDLFLQLYANINKHDLADTNSIKYYLMKSLRRAILRKKKAENIISKKINCSSFHLQLQASETMNEEEQLKMVLVKKFIDRLPIRQKKAVYLRFEQGLSYSEIAQIMHLQIGSVYKIIYKAIEHLKSMFLTNDLKITAVNDVDHPKSRDKNVQILLFYK